MVSVSVVVPTFNRKDMLRRLLGSLGQSTYRDYEVIVVDDASTDGTSDMMRQEFPYATYIRHREETLVAQSRNDGILASKGKYVFFVDDDNTVAPDTIEKLVGAMEADEKIGTAIPLTCFMDRPDTVMSVGANFSKLMRRTTFPYEGAKVSELEGKIVDVDIGGNSFMLRREAAVRAGLIPAERIPWDMEDGYLIYKMKVKLGYRAVVVGSAKVYQYHGPIRGLKRFNEMRLYYHMRSKIVLHTDLDPWPKKATFYLSLPLYFTYFSYLGLRSKAKARGMWRVWQGFFDGVTSRTTLRRIASDSWKPEFRPASQQQTHRGRQSRTQTKAEESGRDEGGELPPYVCVAVVAHRSGEYIEQCLQSVRRQTYPQNRYELLIVDDSDDQKTKTLCQKYGARYIYDPSTDSPGKARNVALKNAKADIIAFIDTDCVAPQNWLATIVEDLKRESDVVGVVGAYCGGKNWIQRMVNKEKVSGKIKSYSTGFLEGNCAFRLSALDGKRFGEYKYGEGIVLAQQLTRTNLQILTDYDLRVVHNGFTHTLRKFYAMGKAHYQNTEAYLGTTLRTNATALSCVGSLVLLAATPMLGPLLAAPALIISGAFVYYAYKWHGPVEPKYLLPAYAYFVASRWIFWAGYFTQLVREWTTEPKTRRPTKPKQEAVENRSAPNNPLQPPQGAQ